MVLAMPGRGFAKPDPQSAASTQGRLHLSTASEKSAPHDRFNHQNVAADVAPPEYENTGVSSVMQAENQAFRFHEKMPQKSTGRLPHAIAERPDPHSPSTHPKLGV